MIGKIVGTYKIVSELGEGGVGTVYRGVDTMLDREVAIKVLRPELVSNNAVVERFRSEAVTLAKLNHPNIATLFSLFRQGDELFMILEFVRGETVEDILQRRGAIPVDEAIPFFCQALNGLNYAHKLNIIHRDIKPSNMILTNDNVLKILDFGIARLLGSSRMTKVGNIIGTLEYMSPEQVRGEETDARSDIYGLGIMLYEILTGRLPFVSDNEFVLMKAHTEEIAVSPRSLNPNIPSEIEAVIVKAIAKNPSERFQNANEFLQTLLELGFSAGENPAFGFESMYQAKTSATFKKEKEKQFHSKDFPKDFAIEDEEITKELNASNAVINQTTAEGKTENTTPAILNETTEFVPDLKEDATLPMPLNSESTMNETAEFVSPDSKIKATRLGDAEVISPSQGEMKATRLGAVAGSESVRQNAAADEKPFPAALLQKLNWMHYAGAGVIAFVLLSVIGIAAVSSLVGGKTEEPAPLANTNPIENTTNKNSPEEETVREDSTGGGGGISNPENTTMPGEEITGGEAIESNTSAPAEVAEDKKPDSPKTRDDKKAGGGGTSKKDTKPAPPNNDRKSDKKGGGKPTTRDTKTDTKLVDSLTRDNPKPTKTPRMIDN